MDPDLVRQQAEAELEHRARPPVMAKGPLQKDSRAPDAALSAVTKQATPAATALVPVRGRAEPIKPRRWPIHLQALFSSSTLAALAGLTAAAWGANQGLAADEQLWLGCDAAALMAVIYGLVLSINGNNFTPAGGY